MPRCLTVMPTEKRISFLGIGFDELSIDTVIDRLASVTVETPFSYIVTPNVDHIVMLDRNPSLRPLYARAALCLCDSRILRRIARLAGIRLSLVPGSDLTRLMFSNILRRGDRITVVGGDPALLQALEGKHPDIEFLHYSPPMGLRHDAAARNAAAEFIVNSRSRFTFISVGAPQQEMIAAEAQRFPSATGMALCVGASLEFLTGHQKRAPRILQTLGLEWLHRLASNPRRLWRRYLVDDIKVIPIFIRSLSFRYWLKTLLAILLLAGLGFVTARGWSRNHSKPTTLLMTLPLPALKTPPVTINLPPPDLIRPLSPDEAGKENAERPFATRPDTPAASFRLDTASPLTAAALTCLTQAVYFEAASEGVEGGRAVAQVIINRARHPAFPATICGVVYQGSDRPTGCQFSFTCDGSLLRPAEAAIMQRSRRIAEKALAGAVFAAVGHSTHYHANYVLPYWADSLDKTAQIGRHLFYRLRGSLGDARLFRKAHVGVEIVPKPSLLTATPQIAPQEANPNFNEIVIPEVARQTDMPSTATASAQRPLADNNKRSLLADELLASGPPKPRKASPCSAALEVQQVKPLSAEKFQPTSGGPIC